jgi:hypothetical protein
VQVQVQVNDSTRDAIFFAAQAAPFVELFIRASMQAAKTPKERAAAARFALLRQALAPGPLPTDVLLDSLQISQATFSRTIQSLGAEVLRFREPEIRTLRYALCAAIPSPHRERCSR